MIMNTHTKKEWLDRIHQLGPDFESRVAEHDHDASFVSENYAALKEHRFFAAAIPEELGGGGVSHSAMCDLLRTLAQYCSSTALAHSMHQHLVAASVWKYRHGQGGADMLKGVAAKQPVLVSTGARDWLESTGEMIRSDGGFRVKAMKSFASQSAIGDVLVTSAPYHSPEAGWQVLHFAVPLESEGVCVLNDWHTLGMRGTGSQTVRLDGVFIPDSSITLRRPRGEFHPVFNVIVMAALPLIMSVYVGIAQKATREAVGFAKRQSRRKPHLPDAIGGMLNRLVSAEVHLQDMIRIANDLDFLPENEIGQGVLCRKTNVANACIDVVTRAMEIVGGQGFYRSFGLERLFRDVQAAKYHPLPEPEQQRFLGEYVLGKSSSERGQVPSREVAGLDPAVNAPVRSLPMTQAA
jgi:alkylation response protein AidB-like acyl-CoA dehydrogenase